MDNKKISIKQMQHLGALEKRLSERESKATLNFDAIPQGSPLEAEIQRQKAAFGDDLSGLPPGHPLLKILAEAKARYEATESIKNAVASTTVNKRVGTSVSKKEVHPTEDKDSARVLAAHKVNRCMEQVDDALKRLLKEIIDNEALINTERVGRAHLFRLKRTADAMRRLLGESRIPGARA